MRIFVQTQLHWRRLLSSVCASNYGFGRGYYRAYAQVPAVTAAYRSNGLLPCLRHQVRPYAAYSRQRLLRAYAQAP